MKMWSAFSPSNKILRASFTSFSQSAAKDHPHWGDRLSRIKKLLEESARDFSLEEIKVTLEKECKYDKLSLISFELLSNFSHLFFRPLLILFFSLMLILVSFKSLCGRLCFFIRFFFPVVIVSFKSLSELYKLWIKLVGFILKNFL